MFVKLEDLAEKHLGKRVKLHTPFETIEGVLTDFYASLDENDDAIVIVEIDDEPVVCSEIPDIEIL